jgi:hypothetical protein
VRRVGQYRQVSLFSYLQFLILRGYDRLQSLDGTSSPRVGAVDLLHLRLHHMGAVSGLMHVDAQMRVDVEHMHYVKTDGAAADSAG